MSRAARGHQRFSAAPYSPGVSDAAGRRVLSDPQLSDPVFLVGELKKLTDICDPLIAEATPSYAGGRRRDTGDSWALLYLCFLCSDVIDIKTWGERCVPAASGRRT